MNILNIRLFSILIFNSVFYLHAQNVLNWINQPYIPGNINNYDSFDVEHLNGNPKSIQETLTIFNPLEKDKNIFTIVNFLENGKISYVEQVLADGSISKTWFEYTDHTYFQRWLFLFNAGDHLDTIRFDSLANTTIEPIFDSTRVNKNNQMAYLKLGDNEVHSYFDKFGRKIHDSVAVRNTYNHEITYAYKKKKLVKRIIYEDGNLNLFITYWLDEKGNWTKCKIKSGRETNAVIRRDINYY